MKKSTPVCAESLSFDFQPDQKHGGRFIDRTGHRFGSLVVLEFAGRNKRNQSLWKCLCDCGNEKVVLSGNLCKGTTTSCGCAQAKSRMSHGEGSQRVGRSAEYGTLVNILQRCYNVNKPCYKHYGALGVTVCEQWNSLEKFPAFLAYVGRRPSGKHSLDRFPDKNGNYEPGNVRWATQQEQMRNYRRNRMIEFQDETLCLPEWADRFGIPQNVLRHRLDRGWTIDRAFNTPKAVRKCST